MQSPPLATQQPHTHTEHGVERPDPYYWLRDRDNPEVISYLEAENAFAAEQTTEPSPRFSPDGLHPITRPKLDDPVASIVLGLQ